MLVTSDDYVHIDHIMWQPLFQCTANCKRCYLRDSMVSAPANMLRTTLIDALLTRQVSCDQLTLSLDANPPRDNLATIKAILYTLSNMDHDIFVTIRDINSLGRWCGVLELPLPRFLQSVHTLTLSSFPSLGKNCHTLQHTCYQNSTKLMYNRLAKPLKDERDEKNLRMGCRYADAVHVILQKNPLGMQQPEEATENYLKTLEIAKQENHTVYEDHCARVALKNAPCSAGIDRVAVWPDGTVTACPYDTNFCTPHRSILETIQDKENHPTQFCPLSKLSPEAQ